MTQEGKAISLAGNLTDDPEHALGCDDAEVLGDVRPPIPGVVVMSIAVPTCNDLGGRSVFGGG